MAIVTFDDYIAAKKQVIQFFRHTQPNLTNHFVHYRYADRAGLGHPTGGNASYALAPGQLVPQSSWFPKIEPFAAGAVGYLSRVDAVAFGDLSGDKPIIEIWDVVYGVDPDIQIVGTTTITSPPDYLPWSPAGDGSDMRMFLETSFSNLTPGGSITVTYTNSDNVAGRTSTIFPPITVTGTWQEIPLQAGDRGVRSIQSIQKNTTAHSGTANVIVARRLWSGIPTVMNNNVKVGAGSTGWPKVYADSSLQVLMIPRLSQSQGPRLQVTFEIASK